ncbi:MAG: EamA family transporter [Alphaproteobacteria bacterium]
MATTTDHTPISRPVMGALLACCAMAVFSSLDAFFKLMLDSYSVFVILLFRSVALVPLISLLVWKNNGLAGFKTAKLPLQLLRGGLLLSMFLMFFTGLQYLDLATAITLTFAAPLFTTLLSIPLLGEKVGIHRLGAVIVGFGGVIVILHPDGDVFGWPALLCLAATLCYSLAMILTRKLGSTEGLTSLVFYQNIVFLIAGLILAPTDWTPVPFPDAYYLLGAGVVTLAAHLAITQAYRIAPPPAIASFDYTTLIWGMILGWLIWQEVPSPLTLVGAGVIIVAGLYVIFREARTGRKKVPAQPAKPPL